MTMHKTLHTKDVIDKLHMSRKEGGSGFTIIEDSIDETIFGLREYTKKKKNQRNQIEAANDSNINRNNLWINS